MEIEILNLTEKNLQDAPEWGTPPFSCKYCIYWEFPEECMDTAEVKKEDLMQKKLEWLRDTNRLFGNCGKILYVDGEAVGYAQYAPHKLLPRVADYQAGPPSEDAVLISCLFIPHKGFRRLGLGSKLLQSIIDDLRSRGIKACETFARKGNPNNPSGPVEFYLKNGFIIYNDDEEFPFMRLEL